MFYTYCHTRNDTNKVFYIGKGMKNRAYETRRRNKYWQNIANKHGYSVEILGYWKNEEQAFDHEVLLISCFKDMGYELTNLTDGGEGIANPSIEVRNKISKALKGRKRSKEFCEKMSVLKLGKPSPRKGISLSNETKRKIQLANIGKTLSEETKKKISDSNKGKVFSEETLIKLSYAAKNRKNS